MPETYDTTSAAPATHLRTIAIVVAAIAILIVAFGIFSRMRAESRLTTWTNAQALPVVTVIHPAPAGKADALTLPGSVQAFNSAAIYARTTGYISRWFVDIGDPVRAGQVLAVLDAPEVDQQVAAARADLQTARANRELAQSTAARWTNLLGKDAVSKQETDEKIGDLAAKNAIANAAGANVRRLGALQGFTRLVAPFSGVVTSRSTQIGALVTAGTAASTPLFTIADVGRMRVYVRVPQAYSGAFHTGLHATLTVPEYPGRSFDVALVRSAGAVDPQSGTVLMEFQAANGDRALKPGAYAQVSLPLGAGSPGAGVRLPPSALVIGANGTQVAVIGPDGKALLKTVTIGRDNGDNVEISAGLTAADKVIDNPPDSLQTGDAVRTMRPGGDHAGS
ncbi:MAG: efflux transporter periplasmic adaptor subunit [Sphingomonas bacterium]|uniref:efflux RND transporter periplasmic adaptor subunit n=1 Tax=Sphingomonas bacterium TaxID=1895847 RepID=UPI00262FE41F|nr:efflux RND transporter periplasmic adaptor subunit [Sphingomonas bacterium]MDB5704999.1 efflux transporter periplasmic adaptor subunit [Sphingomonas bacterium]